MGKRTLVFLTVILLVAFAVAGAKTKSKGHPVDMGSQDCIECHTDVTPEIVKQWQESAHGYINVKCQVCHGDQTDFQKIPKNNTCRGCHAEMVENNTQPKLQCVACHKAHNFTVHKVKDYQQQPEEEK